MFNVSENKAKVAAADSTNLLIGAKNTEADSTNPKLSDSKTKGNTFHDFCHSKIDQLWLMFLII